MVIAQRAVEMPALHVAGGRADMAALAAIVTGIRHRPHRSIQEAMGAVSQVAAGEVAELPSRNGRKLALPFFIHQNK